MSVLLVFARLDSRQLCALCWLRFRYRNSLNRHSLIHRDIQTHTGGYTAVLCLFVIMKGIKSWPLLFHVLANLFSQYTGKLDGVGPVDNRPSTDYLHQFVKKRKKRKKMWHMTRDTWHMTHDTYCEMNILSKCQLSGPHSLGVMMFWRFGGKASVNE